MNTIVFAADDLKKVRTRLLSDRPKEAAAILLAGRALAGEETRLLVREAVCAPPEAYNVQEAARLAISPAFLAPLLKRARLEGWSLIFTHTHPFEGPTHFSLSDDSGERLLMPSLFRRAADRPHGALVLGPSGFDARLWDTAEHVAPVSHILEAGSTVSLHPREASSPEDNPVFDRNVRALGKAGQAMLGQLTIGVVGLGGIGSIVTEQLAHLGVGRLILLDPDQIEASNLNRVVGAGNSDVGRAEVDVAEQLAHRIRPELDIHTTKGSLLMAKDAKALLSAHVIFGCTDTQGSRAVLNQIAYQYLIPVIDIGVIIDSTGDTVAAIAGRVQMLAPGLPCLACQGTLNPEQVRRDLLTPEERARDAYILGNDEPQPAVISLNGTVASLAVTMFLSAVTGFSSGIRHQIYRGEQGTVRVVEATIDPLCVVCSLRGALGRGDLWPMHWRH